MGSEIGNRLICNPYKKTEFTQSEIFLGGLVGGACKIKKNIRILFIKLKKSY